LNEKKEKKEERETEKEEGKREANWRNEALIETLFTNYTTVHFVFYPVKYIRKKNTMHHSPSKPLLPFTGKNATESLQIKPLVGLLTLSNAWRLLLQHRVVTPEAEHCH
jgi:hypothetical protein